MTEVDVRTGAHPFKVDEPPALGGADVAANPVQYALDSHCPVLDLFTNPVTRS
jgi:hypothetical protein